MLPTRVLLALLSLSIVNGFSIQIDVDEGTPTLHQEPMLMLDDAPDSSINTTFVPDDTSLPFNSCPGKCPMEVACPSADKTLRLGRRGTPFIVYCSSYLGADNSYVTYPNVQTLGDCMDICEASNYCIGSQFNFGTKYCYTYRAVKAATANNACHFAVKLSLSLAKMAKCPDDDKKTITTPGGRKYRMYCDIDRFGSFKSAALSTYEECANLCDDTTSCVTSEWSGGQCYMFNNYTTPPTGTTPKPGAVVLVPEGGVTSPPCCPARDST